MKLRVILMITALSTAPAVADVIYKSVGADGHVAYGDTPLAGSAQVDVVNVERIATNRAIADSQKEGQQRIEQMAATTERLQKDRKDREAAAQKLAEARRIDAEKRTAKAVAAEAAYYPDNYLEPYPHRAGRRHKSSEKYPSGGGGSKYHVGLSHGLSNRSYRDEDGYSLPHGSTSGRRPARKSPATFQVPSKN